MRPYRIPEPIRSRIGDDDSSIFEAWIKHGHSDRMSDFHWHVVHRRFIESVLDATDEHVQKISWILWSIPDWPLCTGEDATGWTGRMAPEPN
jgi:hypothetical protein